MYFITVKLQAAEGKENELGRLMSDTATKVTQNEKETITYVALRNINNHSEFLFYEQYISKENWEQVHMKMPYIVEFVEMLPNLTNGEVDITEYETID
jgi:quinol monooxygenase YgiN